MSDEGQGALTQLKAWLAQQELPANSRLPPERELCDVLGVSRGELRKALAALEQNGDVWRHVGKGTFIGAKPVEEFFSIAAIARQSSPRDVMQSRLLIEPLIAGEAALNATPHNLEEMRDCISGTRSADTWRQYETWDNQLHRSVAEASHNAVLLALFDTLNAVRRTVLWSRSRTDPKGPPPNHHSFTEHEDLVIAIQKHDSAGASEVMRTHLQSVQNRLLNGQTDS